MIPTPQPVVGRATPRADRRGIALVIALLLVAALGAVAFGMLTMTLNSKLVGKNNERTAVLDAIATAGLEEARSRLNGQRTLYPSTGYVTLEDSAAVKDALNATIPGVSRSTWVGPSGITSGQFGVVGTIITRAKDGTGNTLIRRLDVNQESFSKYAYFTNFETDTSGNTIVFGGGDQIRGPVHSNDQLKVNTGTYPQVTFYDQVTSAASTIQNQANGLFSKPPMVSQARIPMPTVADLNKLDSLATVGNTRFTGSTAGDAGEAVTRITFLVDTIPALGADSVQGFFRIYQGTDPAYVSASLPTTFPFLESSRNCGDLANGTFLAADRHTAVMNTLTTHGHGALSAGTRSDSALIRSNGGSPTNNPARTVRCYLGGDSILTNDGAPNASWMTSGHRDNGAWVQAPSAIRNAVAMMGSVITNRPDANYLFPLNRQYNPNFKGVIFVAGKVILDGVVHGRVTVAATGNIIFGDDVTYLQNPATRDCATGDIIGFFSGQSLIVSNNTLNAPQTLNTNASRSTAGGTFYSYGATDDETIHGFFLTLKTFGAEENGFGSTTAQPCRIGGTINWGRGCLNTYGGIIQGNRGAVGTSAGTGYVKRYQYDACGATNPPPYYPTTGVFKKNRFSQIDPTRFSVAAWFAANQN